MGAVAMAPPTAAVVDTRCRFTSTPRGSLKKFADRFAVRVLSKPEVMMKVCQITSKVFIDYQLKGGALYKSLSMRAERFYDQLYRPLARIEKLYDIDVCVGAQTKKDFVEKLRVFADAVESDMIDLVRSKLFSVEPQVIKNLDCLFGKAYDSTQKRQLISCYAVSFTRCTETELPMMLGRIGVMVKTHGGTAVQLSFMDIAAIELTADSLQMDDGSWKPYSCNRGSILKHLCTTSRRMLGVDCTWNFNRFDEKTVRRVDRCVYASLLSRPQKHEESIKRTIYALSCIDCGDYEAIAKIPFPWIRKIVRSAFENCKYTEDFVDLIAMLLDSFTWASDLQASSVRYY